tara:strand:- start:2086 stop:2520 length:435 start_codon:yes stop_codon:yes gene_type:complete
MQKVQESERSIQRAKISWEQSKQDLEMAKSFINTNPDTSCLLSNQAAINAFSSILNAKGFFQLPAYSSIEMLNICSSVFQEFEITRIHCNILDSSLNRDLLGQNRQKNISFTPAFAKKSYEASLSIQKIIHDYLKKHKDKFFNP